MLCYLSFSKRKIAFSLTRPCCFKNLKGIGPQRILLFIFFYNLMAWVFCVFLNWHCSRLTLLILIWVWYQRYSSSKDIFGVHFGKWFARLRPWMFNRLCECPIAALVSQAGRCLAFNCLWSSSRIQEFCSWRSSWISFHWFGVHFNSQRRNLMSDRVP